MPIKVRYNGLEIDGNLLPLYSGAIHYWRLEPERWDGLLDKVKGLGFQVIETYVPWSIHELAPGEFDFGRIQAAKNLDRFLTLAEERGLKAIVRPGPHINSELEDFGYPRRILDQERFWALDAEGAPMVLMGQTHHFKVPSHANEDLITEFEPFLAHLAPILQKHLHPHGCVVALQVDNETGYFFRPGPYDLDYSAPSLALYRHFLELKYRQLKGMNDAHGVKLKAFADAEAPRDPFAKTRGEARQRLDWVEYKEYQLLWSLSKLTELFRAKGLGSVPLFQNYYGVWETPFNIPDVEKDSGLEFVGLDSYPHKENGAWALDQARYLAASSSFAYFPEFGSGSWPLGIRARDLADQEATVLLPIMGGAKGLNFYMTVERDRWLGCPISAQGVERPELANLMRRFLDFVKTQEWHKATPQNQGLIVSSREAQWIRHASMRAGHFSERGFFPDALWTTPIHPEHFGAKSSFESFTVFGDAAKQWAREAQYPFGLADSGIPSDKLRKHTFAVVSAWGLWDESFARRLRSYVESGGLLIMGPELPALNTRFQALESFKDIVIESGKPLNVGDGKILLMSEFDGKALSAFLKKSRVLPELTLSDPGLDLALHKLAGRSILFVRNPTAENRSCVVYHEGKFVLKPLWSREKFLGAVEERDVRLAPYETKVWELIPC